MNQPDRETAILDASETPTLWINEIVSIDFFEDVAIVAFGETVRVKGDLREQRIRARVAMSRGLLLSLASRIERLSEQARALQRSEGSA